MNLSQYVLLSPGGSQFKLSDGRVLNKEAMMKRLGFNTVGFVSGFVPTAFRTPYMRKNCDEKKSMDRGRPEVL